MSNEKPLYYGDYLQLGKILGAQTLESDIVGHHAHDEMLFIITHQAYELWFKQIIFELDSVIDVFDDPVVEDKNMGRVLHRLSRIKAIQRLLLNQIDVIETMTPLDFMEFRDLLTPATGFQSVQFKTIEIKLGIRRNDRIPADKEFFESRLNKPDLSELDDLETKPSLIDLTDRWLERMPFLEFGDYKFWPAYAAAVEKMLASDRVIVEKNTTLSDREKEFQLASIDRTKSLFQSILDEGRFNELRNKGEFRFSHQGFLAALFINLYREEPMLYTPFRYLTLILEIDKLFTNWRQRHAMMVQRMLGTKIGTGGSSGHDYLNKTTQRNQVFNDLNAVSTFLIPRTDLPVLPAELRQALGFFFEGKK